MIALSSRLCAGLAACLAFAVAHASPTLLVSGNGILLGADGVLVDGMSYDVRFVDGTCSALFNGCSPSSFAFTTQAAATAAARVLLDTVFIDGPLGDFDSHPEQTNGCTNAAFCYASVPYLALSNYVLVDNASNYSSVGDATGLGGWYQSDDLGDGHGDYTWAVFTASVAATAVPEPASITLLFAGAGALMALSRRGRASRRIRAR